MEKEEQQQQLLNASAAGYTCVCADCAVWGLSIGNVSNKAHIFSVFSSLNSSGKIAESLPMHQASACGRVLAPGLALSGPKQWRPEVHVKR